MGRLAVEGNKEIYFEDYAGEGRPLVLVHGWGMSCRVWDYNLPALRAAGHRVVTLDHRGLAEPVIVGWSLGAAVSVEAAEALGARAAGLALVGTPSPRYLQAADWEIGGTPEAMAETKEALRTNRAPFLHDLTLGVFKNEQTPAMIEWMWSIFMETSPNADQTLIALGELDHRELMPTLDLPALLCVGAGDLIVDPRTSAEAGKLLPNGRVVEFADSGHAPFIEEQEKFERELLDFLRGI
jgi:non-heme chloroperoxidase